ncbi:MULTISPECIES: hypothetical protein [Halomonas]|uniref:hypothetical protein n=1 Tax=Halomonas TaxID=2745 RepID=UPI001865FCFA|nr:hypothetical protein [Halomonas citrativorans]
MKMKVMLYILATGAIAWFSSKIVLWMVNAATGEEYSSLLTTPQLQYAFFVVLFAILLAILKKSYQRRSYTEKAKISLTNS